MTKRRWPTHILGWPRRSIVAGQYDEALDVVKEFLERFPDQPEAFYEQAIGL